MSCDFKFTLRNTCKTKMLNILEMVQLTTSSGTMMALWKHVRQFCDIFGLVRVWVRLGLGKLMIMCLSY